MASNTPAGYAWAVGYSTTSTAASPTWVASARSGGGPDITATFADASRGRDSSQWTEKLPVKKDWTANFQMVGLSTAVTHRQDTLRDFLTSGSRRYWWITDSTVAADNGYTWKGWGYVESFTLSFDETDIQLHTFNLTGDGALTEAASTF